MGIAAGCLRVERTGQRYVQPPSCLKAPRQPQRRKAAQASHIVVLDLPAAHWLPYLQAHKVRISQQRGGMRVSFGMFNTGEDVDRFVKIVAAGLQVSGA